MKRSGRAALVLGVVATSRGGVALAQDANGPLDLQPKDAAAARHIRLERQALGFIYRATAHAAALKAFAAIRRDLEHIPAEPTTPQDGIYLFTRGGGGGGAGIADFLDRGTLLRTGAGAGHRDRSRLLGLVPDGVASVTLEYPRTVSRGRYYKPTVYWRDAAGAVIHVFVSPGR